MEIVCLILFVALLLVVGAMQLMKTRLEKEIRFLQEVNEEHVSSVLTAEGLVSIYRKRKETYKNMYLTEFETAKKYDKEIKRLNEKLETYKTMGVLR